MRRILFLAAALAVVGYAKPTFVPGAACKSCHEAMPATKTNLNKATQDMVKKYKVEECKNCHGWKDGKFTTKQS